MPDLEVINGVVTVRLSFRGSSSEPCRFTLSADNTLLYAYGALTTPRHNVWSHMETNGKFQENAGLIAQVANALRAAKSAPAPCVRCREQPQYDGATDLCQRCDTVQQDERGKTAQWLADEIRDRAAKLNHAINIASLRGVKAIPRVRRTGDKSPFNVVVDPIVLVQKL